MQLFLLSNDSDTLTGLRLAGIDGCLVATEEDLLQALDRLQARSDIAVLLVTRTLSSMFPQQIDALKHSAKLLVSEIPDMANPTADTDAITRYVAQAVGTAV